jgi:hypothetical protein
VKRFGLPYDEILRTDSIRWSKRHHHGFLASQRQLIALGDYRGPLTTR